MRQDCDPGRQDHDPGKQKLKGAVRTETYRRHYCQHRLFFSWLAKHSDWYLDWAHSKLMFLFARLPVNKNFFPSLLFFSLASPIERDEKPGVSCRLQTGASM
jgi:hypothetical protein